ncbi:MAG: tRNA uridine-5-carboxymethylaminomethyl(34) synthesis GTPase MnmE [Ignavibacteria bacterium]|nr:MAG: tRNA uridine-5-carboxymethylaminomethyl(34) synthesis GTPase MnmE [Ignavibacteria bacterium]
MTGTAPNTTAEQPTIAAVATPPGTGGIAVIRVSGDQAISVASRVFVGTDIETVDSHTAHHGRIQDAAGDVIDDVLLTVFHAPRSYTGENSVEISCHGGAIIAQSVLRRLLEVGAVHAEAGEYTRRAFLNGKMDLSQAEAVADLIHAQSEEARRASVDQLEGVLSAYIGEVRESLMNAASMMELSLDFVEEDVSFLSAAELTASIADAAQRIEQALSTYASGRLIRDGVRVALLGPPNVGKSSLLNRLLSRQRAIVTDIPGTTRDYLEEQVLLQGEYFRLIDTAGLRDSSDSIELEGMAISRRIMQEADIVCLLSDAREGVAAGTGMRLRLESSIEELPLLTVFNKADLVSDEECDALSREGEVISALDGDGIDSLKNTLVARARSMRGASEKGMVLVTNARHAECLRRALAALVNAKQAGERGQTEEFLAYEVRQAIDALSEIIGEVTTEDLLNSIFARFCIGK